MPVECAAVHRRAADEVDTYLRIAVAEALANDLPGELRSHDCIGPGVPNLAFTDVAREVAHAPLKMGWRRAPRRAPHCHAIGRGLGQCPCREVGSHVRRQVAVNIRYFVEQLLGGGRPGDTPASPLNLADNGIAVRVNVSKREA